MEKLKINYKTIKEIYIVYNEKHKFLEILHIDININTQEFLTKNKNAKYYEKITMVQAKDLHLFS